MRNFNNILTQSKNGILSLIIGKNDQNSRFLTGCHYALGEFTNYKYSIQQYSQKQIVTLSFKNGSQMYRLPIPKFGQGSGYSGSEPVELERNNSFQEILLIAECQVLFPHK